MASAFCRLYVQNKDDIPSEFNDYMSVIDRGLRDIRQERVTIPKETKRFLREVRKIGCGPAMKQYAQGSANPIAEWVPNYLLGLLSRDQVKRFVGTIDLFWHPSRRDPNAFVAKATFLAPYADARDHHYVCARSDHEADKRIVVGPHFRERLASRLTVPHINSNDRYRSWDEPFTFLNCLERYFYCHETGMHSIWATFSDLFYWSKTVRVCLGRKPELNKNAYLLGYAPSIQQAGVVFLKTILYPGMKGTPEHKYFKEHSNEMPILVKTLIDNIIADKTERYRKVFTEDYFELQHFFHERGIAQARHLDNPILADFRKRLPH